MGKGGVMRLSIVKLQRAVTKFLRTARHARHLHFCNLLLSIWHVSVVSQSMGHDLPFTLVCVLCYMYAFELERLALTRRLQTLRWFVIFFTCGVVGIQLTYAKEIRQALSLKLQVPVSLWAAAGAVTAVLMLFEVLGAIIYTQSVRTCIMDGDVVATCGGSLIPIECPNPGTLRIDVNVPQDSNVVAILLDAPGMPIGVLEGAGGFLTIEHRAVAKRYFLYIRKLDGLGAELKAHLHISIKND
jgi:hypothetical protein